MWGAVAGGGLYIIQKLMTPQNSNAATSGTIPSEPISSLDEAPLGGHVSDDLLKILVCPEDKGPVELIEQGHFLFNPRNGYRYPIRNGIPVMLIEEGKKYQQTSSMENAMSDDSIGIS